MTWKLLYMLVKIHNTCENFIRWETEETEVWFVYTFYCQRHKTRRDNMLFIKTSKTMNFFCTEWFSMITGSHCSTHLVDQVSGWLKNEFNIFSYFFHMLRSFVYFTFFQYNICKCAIINQLPESLFLGFLKQDLFYFI